MKLIMVGVFSLVCLSACGSEVVVGDAGGGSAGLGSSGAPTSGGAVSESGGATNGNTPWGDPTAAPACSESPASYETYSSSEELNELLIGRWQRCVAPQIPGEDIGVEFTADGKYYPLTADETLQVVRRTGVDYEGTWLYIPAGDENPILHTSSDRASLLLNEVTTGAPQFTNDPRQLRITFSPVLSKYVPLNP